MERKTAHESQFQSILPDTILETYHTLPYSALWPSELGVPSQKLSEFNNVFRCKQKFVELVKRGAIEIGDEFGVLCHFEGGGEDPQWRYAKVCF